MYIAHDVIWPGDLPAPGARYRPLLAACSPDEGEAAVSPRIFHRDPETGRTLNSVSPFRFSSRPEPDGGMRMRLTAIGAEAADLLDRERWKIARALSTSAGRPLSDRTEYGFCTLKITNEPRELLVNHLVTARYGKHIPKIQDPDHIRTVILRGLEGQFALLGRPMPEGVDDAIYDLTIEDGTFAVPISHGKTAGGVRTVRLVAALDLRGPWSVGPLVSRGLGRILHVPQAAHRVAA